MLKTAVPPFRSGDTLVCCTCISCYKNYRTNAIAIAVFHMDFSAFLCYAVRNVTIRRRRSEGSGGQGVVQKEKGETMINISGHLRDKRNVLGFCDESVDFMVNCCGKQMFLEQNYFLNREKGRLDYQLIYIYKGAGHFYLNQKWEELLAGNVVLYRPMEPQWYAYYAKDKPEIYWIHFTGSQCEAVLNRYAVENCYIGENLSVKLLFQYIITELQLKKMHYENIVLANFSILLSTIHRSFEKTLRPYENDFTIDRLICELNSKYMQDWSVASMADFCKLSDSYFSHTFRQRMGVSPMRFLNNLRIEKAKDFLMTNSMSVAAAAQLAGFKDPLYFSRVFKKYTGIAPNEFYHSCADENTPEWFQGESGGGL